MKGGKDTSGKASQRKGADGERELAAVLREYGYEIKRGGSMSFGEVPDLVGLPGVHIEVKRCEQVRLSEWMQQAERDTQTVEILCRALSSPYNSYDFAKTDIYNYGNVVMEVITTMIANKSLVDTKVYRLLEELFKKINT